MKIISYVWIIIMLLSLALTGRLLTVFSSDYELIETGSIMENFCLNVAYMAGWVLMLSNGTFVKTKYFKITQGLMSILIIGALLKIMHWTTYADYLIVFGLLGILIAYSISFYKKPIKKRLDYLKLTWVILLLSSTILILLRVLSMDYRLVGDVVFWILLLDFCITKTNLFSKQQSYS
ncbi:MAG: hypothetical protein MK202_11205 [Tenacibaculum sp.]|nr:hypothetical protein [Tenacibaculum sp.]